MTVPLPTNILAEDIREIIKEAECAALVVSLREVPGLAPIIASCPTVRNVIIMDRYHSTAADFLDAKPPMVFWKSMEPPLLILLHALWSTPMCCGRRFLVYNYPCQSDQEGFDSTCPSKRSSLLCACCAAQLGG